MFFVHFKFNVFKFLFNLCVLCKCNSTDLKLLKKFGIYSIALCFNKTEIYYVKRDVMSSNIKILWQVRHLNLHLHETPKWLDIFVILNIKNEKCLKQDFNRINNIYVFCQWDNFTIYSEQVLFYGRFFWAYCYQIRWSCSCSFVIRFRETSL